MSENQCEKQGNEKFVLRFDRVDQLKKQIETFASIIKGSKDIAYINRVRNTVAIGLSVQTDSQRSKIQDIFNETGIFDLIDQRRTELIEDAKRTDQYKINKKINSFRRVRNGNPNEFRKKVPSFPSEEGIKLLFQSAMKPEDFDKLFEELKRKRIVTWLANKDYPEGRYFPAGRNAGFRDYRKNKSVFDLYDLGRGYQDKLEAFNTTYEKNPLPEIQLTGNGYKDKKLHKTRRTLESTITSVIKADSSDKAEKALKFLESQRVIELKEKKDKKGRVTRFYVPVQAGGLGKEANEALFNLLEHKQSYLKIVNELRWDINPSLFELQVRQKQDELKKEISPQEQEGPEREINPLHLTPSAQPQEPENTPEIESKYSYKGVDITVIKGVSGKGRDIVRVVGMEGGYLNKVSIGNIYALDSLPIDLRFAMFPEEQKKHQAELLAKEAAREAMRKEQSKANKKGEKKNRSNAKKKAA